MRLIDALGMSCLLAVAIGALPVAVAVAEEGAPSVVAVNLVEIRVQQTDLKQRLENGELSLTPRQANALRASQAEAFDAMQGATELTDLDMNRRVRLGNALERINALVVGTLAASSSRQVCKRAPVTGSAMKTTRCATQAEWDQVREQSRNSLEKKRMCEPPGCGS